MNKDYSLINEIKSRINILDLAHKLGLKPDNQGLIFSIYKKETNRSLKLYPKTNSYYCFATGKGGDVINFYADYKKIDNKQAIKELSKEFGLENFNNTLKNKEEEKIIDLGKSIKIYQSLEKFCSSPDEKSTPYLIGPKRGLTEETIKKFRLFTIKDINSTVDHLRQCYDLDELRASGLFNSNEKFVFTKHRLIIPYLNGEEIIYLRGRIISENTNDEVSKYIGLAGITAKRFFNASILESLKEKAEVLLCEGEFDTIVATQQGYPAIGIPGVNNFPSSGEDILNNYNVFLCFDNDDAGRKAMQEVTNKMGTTTKGVFLKSPKDLTEYFCSSPNSQLLSDTEVDVRDLKPEIKRKSQLSILSARDIQELDLPPVEWIVKDLLLKGLTILAAPPKSGKSFLALNLALSIVEGTTALGYFETKKCKVLFVALEDGLRRIKARMNNILSFNLDKHAPENLLFPQNYSDFPKINEGGLKEIENLVEDDPEIKLIIIDTLAKSIADKRRSDLRIYRADYDLISGLQQLATQKNICILLIHHTKKGSEENVFDEISGTRGITGATDTMLVMKKTDKDFSTLHVVGRDVKESDYKLVFDTKLCCWNVVEKQKESDLTPEKEEIINLIKKNNRSMKTGEISELLGKGKSNVSKLLGRLCSDGILKKPKYGCYELLQKNDNGKKVA